MIEADAPNTRPSFKVALPNNVNTRAAAFHCFFKEASEHFINSQFDNASYWTRVILASGKGFYLTLALDTDGYIAADCSKDIYDVDLSKAGFPE